MVKNNKKRGSGNSQRFKYTIEDMQAIACKKGGLCLSTEYKGIKHELLWQCAKGHKWSARPFNILTRGYWCPVCATDHEAVVERAKKSVKNKLTYEEIRRRGDEVGLKFLQEKERNKSTRIFLWQCSKGHTFWSVSKPLRSCPECIKEEGKDKC